MARPSLWLAYQIDNGSFDNRTLDHLDLSEYLFTCDDLGQNTVILTATDACGNTGPVLPPPR